MCGIAGLIDKKLNEKQALKIVEEMINSLKHRGPDDHGVNKVDKEIYFGNRRLAVLDLSPLGHQPMKAKKGKYWLSYNGEVYNFKELRQELKQKGFKFKSTSDTEVILKLYMAYGVRAFSKLRGMFALAIWDKDKQELILVRDQFGIKPLHYYFKNGQLAFASEIKALLKHPQIYKQRQLDKQALSLYFSTGFGAVPSPWTIFQKIKKLPPGCYLRFKNNKLVIKEYWSLKNIKAQKMPFAEAVDRAGQLLEESIKEQMIADVPVGSFLSGGIDSSMIAALMIQNTKHKVKTFSIGFEDKSFDESSHARLMANHLGTEHHEETFGEKDLLNSITKILDGLDEPLADASVLPMYLLAKMTKKKVTVALSGDGGDELFAGYPTYLAHKIMSAYRYTPKMVRKLLIAAVNQLAASDKNLTWEWNLKRLIKAETAHPALSHLDFMAPLRLDEQKQLFKKDYIDEVAKKLFIDIYNQPAEFDKQKRLQYLDFKFFLIDDGLVKGDRATNMVSLEGRVPFLSVKLAELVYSLPGSYHYKGQTSKRLLKAVAKKYLPDEIIHRPKKGFGVPMAKWLKTDLRPMTKEYLNEKKIKSQGIFKADYVKRLIDEHNQGKQNHRMALWALLCFQYWQDKWG